MYSAPILSAVYPDLHTSTWSVNSHVHEIQTHQLTLKHGLSKCTLVIKGISSSFFHSECFQMKIKTKKANHKGIRYFFQKLLAISHSFSVKQINFQFILHSCITISTLKKADRISPGGSYFFEIKGLWNNEIWNIAIYTADIYLSGCNKSECPMVGVDGVRLASFQWIMSS